MAAPQRHPLIAGAGITGLGTLVSRLLGMVRDMATAALLGLSGSGVMDAFVIAFRIPNLFRRLFGEGALAASYLPVFAAELVRDRRGAWKMASTGLFWLTVFLTALVLAILVLCGLGRLAFAGMPRVELLLGLVAVMAPYLLFTCLAAQVAATLHALGHFSTPAVAPALLNVCWLAAAWFVAPRFASDQASQAYVLAAAVSISGVLQLAVQFPALGRLGFRFEYDWQAARGALAEVVRAMVPMLLGLAVTQLNTLADSLIAWGLSSAPGGPQTIGWLGGSLHYPMRQGAAAAIYYGERLYQFPLGILGMAVATAIFPLLSRHAAHGERDKLGADLTIGLRLVVLLGVPASVGLIVLAEPLARLLFEHGRFTADDTARAARMIACYAAGVWAYCALPVVIRGFYALGDRTTPVRVGAIAVGLNLALNLTLIWPLAEAGLAVATSLSAALQVALLAAVFSRARSPLSWRAVAATTGRTLPAAALMGATGYATLAWLPEQPGLANELARVFLPVTLCSSVFFAAYRLLGGKDLGLLLAGREQTA
jgi:putative peptidoglycan lipid II flippase